MPIEGDLLWLRTLISIREGTSGCSREGVRSRKGAVKKDRRRTHCLSVRLERKVPVATLRGKVKIPETHRTNGPNLRDFGFGPFIKAPAVDIPLAASKRVKDNDEKNLRKKKG